MMKLFMISTSDLNPEFHASQTEPENPCGAKKIIFLKNAEKTMYLPLK